MCLDTIARSAHSMVVIVFYHSTWPWLHEGVIEILVLLQKKFFFSSKIFSPKSGLRIMVFRHNRSLRGKICVVVRVLYHGTRPRIYERVIGILVLLLKKFFFSSQNSICDFLQNRAFALWCLDKLARSAHCLVVIVFNHGT